MNKGTKETDFIVETAKFMAADRPDIYPDESTAAMNLAEAIGYCRDSEQIAVSFTSYVLFKVEDDGMVEWMLTRKISTLAEYPEEKITDTWAHTRGSGAITVQVELPDILDTDS